MSAGVSTKNRSRMSVNTIAKVSILGALAFLVMLFEIPLPFAPAFYKLGFDEVIVLIGGFALGPWAAVCIEALKIALNLLFNGTITAGTGELSNFLIGLAFVLPATFVYHQNKTRKNACIGLIYGTISMTIMGGLINYFIILPAYSFFMKIPLDALIAMGTAINPNINGLLAFVLLSTVPFNLLKGVLVSLIVFISYKKVSPVIKKQ
ncbi:MULTISPECIES: ECF transporter S component [Bacillota]|jgi:riboflavin transporter|uniref:Riboflavin transporter n=1 Tax=Amedibacillus hominis TaxID=2897776 RepID=A0ABS9RD89_9FIRM|nr:MULTISPECIES: ECF transporter S component [Bacillota]MCH4287602.1 ECF transporter S component [Amedibacillus hominis]RGB48623.1 ECF transporter S component [Absiella sp. AM22-9]RGB52686.1 ECF transporter S component [Absiella sp. AM10-20]RGB67489.1 ECF transporter S component [Absiella sp. AM09-45]RGB76826.1 ECF transporter S component [Absiella sp. AM09-50]